MNKNAIQKFAIWARNELIAQVSQRAYQYGIDESGFGDASADTLNGRLLTAEEQSQRQELIKQIEEKGYQQVMEEVAYTWFNRFIALRFMEVNGFLPSHIRVFSDASGALKPEILNDVLHLDLPGLDSCKVAEYIENNDTEALYRYLLLTQCNALNSALPNMFERMGGYTEMLLPNNILRQDSVLGHMVSDIPEEDWQDAVQIIGWLYQYYNTELKEQIDRVQGVKKISREMIPAATQLFTPDWIVRYMVENSLGRLWLEGHPNTELRDGWKYYLDEAEQERSVEAQLAKLREEYKTIKPEEIKVIDPCMGSGHILVYAFDVLMQIYTSAGWDQREAAQSILKNNLYGLDIDERAAQLAYFAVMMKARQYDRRLFTRGIQPNIFSVRESNGIQAMTIEYFHKNDPKLKADIESIVTEMRDAKEYGSILNITLVDFAGLYARFDEIRNDINMMQMSALDELLPLVKCAELLAQKYDVVVTNPPYMGSRLLNDKLRNYLAERYPRGKTDTYAAFLLQCNKMRHENGYAALMTPNTWLTINSYSRVREYFITTKSIHNMLIVSGEAFKDAGVVVNSAVFGPKTELSTFCEMQGFTGEDLSYGFGSLKKDRTRTRKTIMFYKLPNMIIDPSISEKMIETISKCNNVYSAIISDGQTKTGDNDRFLRMVWEPENVSIGVSKKWCLHAKGGAYRKWYGNVDTVIDWSPEARYFYQKNHVARITPEYLWYKEGITWSLISGQHNAFRLLPENYTFNCAAPTVFTQGKVTELYILALLNTGLAQSLLSKFNATINLTIDDIGSIPYIWDDSQAQNVIAKATMCINLSAKDWDSYETSWDFKRNPLVNGNRLTIAYAAWKQECEDRFRQLKKNEEELNRIFIDIYGLQDELTPDVADKDVTVHRVFDSKDDVPESMKGSNYVRTMRDEIVSLISYAVGCMFGRYSLDVDGLACAGGEWDASKYKTIIPDNDNIIPICDDEYFDDDITGRFVEFVRKVYGDDTLEENLKFVADALGGKGTPREVIRSYFLNDFYADHLKTYQKRPIYWLFDSGKKNGFKALCYMHRYQRDLLARLRTDYVHEQQERYRTQLAQLGDAIDHASASERVKLTKQQKKFQDQATELQKYEEKVHHLADQNIEIDLDDGVKHNYELFADVLAKIK